jgi:hypothetical protein
MASGGTFLRQVNSRDQTNWFGLHGYPMKIPCSRSRGVGSMDGRSVSPRCEGGMRRACFLILRSMKEEPFLATWLRPCRRSVPAGVRTTTADGQLVQSGSQLSAFYWPSRTESARSALRLASSRTRIRFGGGDRKVRSTVCAGPRSIRQARFANVLGGHE